MKTPDITPAQIVSLVGAALAVGATFGLDLDRTQVDSILAFVGLLAGLVLADAHLRGKRTAIRAAEVTALAAQPTKGDAPTDPPA